MKILIIISSKSPNNKLLDCIYLLYTIQINNDCNLNDYKICVIDSDSNDFSIYNQINILFPDVDIHYVKNKNYEYGAWKSGLELYLNYDIYFCIQDTMLIHKYIDLSVINNNTVYTWHQCMGYRNHQSIRNKGIELLNFTGLNYHSLIDSHFSLAYGSFFIVNNLCIKDIFETFKMPPIDKDGSCNYERLFGLYFIIKNINTLDVSNYFIKYNGGRL